MSALPKPGRTGKRWGGRLSDRAVPGPTCCRVALSSVAAKGRMERLRDLLAPPQTPPGKHFDPQNIPSKRNVAPRMRRGITPQSPLVTAPLSGEPAAIRKKPPLKGEVRLSKNPGELERAAALSNFQSCPAACTVGTGRFLRRKISFSRAKIVSLQFLRPEIS